MDCAIVGRDGRCLEPGAFPMSTFFVMIIKLNNEKNTLEGLLGQVFYFLCYTTDISTCLRIATALDQVERISDDAGS
jgi:hypothetical protein